MARKGRRWGVLVSGMIVGVMATWLTGSYHVVRSGQHCLLLPRVEAGWSDVYVDIRQWTTDEWRRHPRLVAAIRQAGRNDLLPRAPRRYPFPERVP